MARVHVVAFSDIEPNMTQRMKWGDYWFKRRLEESLERRGHQIDRACEVLIHLYGVPIEKLPPNVFNIIWVYSHPQRLRPADLRPYQRIFCQSESFTARLNERGFDTTYLMGATAMEPVEAGLKHDVVFVANVKTARTRRIIEDLGEDLPYEVKIWGSGWLRPITGPYYENHLLPELYASSKVCLNDHHLDMRALGFLNVRVLDIVASGGFCISDNAVSIERIFGDAVPTYKTPEELRELVAHYVEHPEERASFIEKGVPIAREYTFDMAAERLMEGLE